MIGNEINFIPHLKFNVDEILELPHIDNLILKAEKDEDKWIEETTEVISEWKSTFSSTYIRWALCINGLSVACEKYSNPNWYEEMGFTISSLRAGKSGPEQSQLVFWDGITAAEAHKKTIGMVAAWGVIDLYSCIEDFVFKVYSIFLEHYPLTILQGSEFRELKRLFKKRYDSDEDYSLWVKSWKERLESWHRKKLYDGLDKVFIAYCKHTKIKEPSTYKLTTIEDWAETIKGISILRNCLIHGEQTVPKELDEFSQKINSMTFDFKENQPLKVDLHHLQSIEMFTNQLLTALNLCFIELKYPDISKI